MHNGFLTGKCTLNDHVQKNELNVRDTTSMESAHSVSNINPADQKLQNTAQAFQVQSHGS